MARVLIAEDHEGMRRTLREICEMSGFTCHEVDDGRQVAQAARSFSPDVVLLDLFLPGSHGRAVLDELREGPCAHIPVIVLSITPEEIEPGRSAYRMRKPFDVDELIGAISRLTSSPPAMPGPFRL